MFLSIKILRFRLALCVLQPERSPDKDTNQVERGHFPNSSKLVQLKIEVNQTDSLFDIPERPKPFEAIPKRPILLRHGMKGEP